ncbi:nitrate- and nitrite sensing domain-containing protein [Streptomyces sp. IB2014 016-6]|uniref:sensor histidine kinase n=1 Tax=Streptomyces sp. IB2014 016-6 TaxID=2517818 RepID=UPI001F4F62C5|nr:nitrate- and nitrite sensing domain-containing protein [Streptomyces sp. IB2014 016-6]
MRAPVQKKRPRGKGGTRGGSQGPAEPRKAGTAGSADAPEVPAGRPVRVRSRLVAAVAVVGVTVVAAGLPAVLATSAELTDAQRLVTLAELNRQTAVLAHSLADERDEVVVHIAGGREDAGSDKGDGDEDEVDGDGADGAPGGDPATRVDRQIDEIDESASPGLRRDLSTVPSIRRTALTGKGTALEAYQAYTDVIAKLHAISDEVAEKTPPEAADGTRAPAALGRAVEQASATRGLLLAALAVPAPNTEPRFDPVTGLPVQPADGGDSAESDRTRDALSAAAQQARVHELASLADFDQSAGTKARDSLATTVTGPEVTAAEKYLTRLTDSPELSDSDRDANQEKVESSLSSRIEQMRGVESGIGSAQLKRLEQLRDDSVTSLELGIALLGGLLIVSVGVSTAIARTLTRPLAVVRIGAARLAAGPATEEPVRFTGRNDEFGQVVRSLNSLHAQFLDVSARAEKLDSERTGLIGARQAMADQRTELQERAAGVTAQLEGLRSTVHHTFVDLSLRTLGLVERQLGVIETLEEREQDPDRLGVLFQIDHMATVMRRHNENLLMFAGHEYGGSYAGPVPLVDVLRAAVSEIEKYERVTIQSLPPHAQLAGFAADDISHLVAELLENATSFSPPDAQVELSGWMLESGDAMLSVQDRGIGMSAARIAELNQRIADPHAYESPKPASKTKTKTKAKSKQPLTDEPGKQAATTDGEGDGLGLRVAALLATRHGVEITLREHQQGGIAAVVVLPQALLPTARPVTAPLRVASAGAAPVLTLPGSVAEANSNALPGRSDREPLVAAPEESAGDPYAIGPDTHERVADAADEATDEAADGATDAAEAPAVSVPETEEADRTDVTAGTDEAQPPAETSTEPVTDAVTPAVTDKGLPKRTPKAVKSASTTADRTGSVDADALRRRLGGFHRGAKAGKRDADAELLEQTEVQQKQSSSVPRQTEAAEGTDARTNETGETVEEARS